MNGVLILEKNKIDGRKFDTVLIILFLIGWFTIGFLFSAIGCVIIYLIFRKSLHYPDKVSDSGKKLIWKQWLIIGLIVIVITFIVMFSIFLFVF